jgi:hypothetical protein
MVSSGGAAGSEVSEAKRRPPCEHAVLTGVCGVAGSYPMWTGEGGKLAYTYLVRLHPTLLIG